MEDPPLHFDGFYLKKWIYKHAYFMFLIKDRKAQQVAEIIVLGSGSEGPMHFTYVVSLLTQALFWHVSLLGEEAITFS